MRPYIKESEWKELVPLLDKVPLSRELGKRSPRELLACVKREACINPHIYGVLIHPQRVKQAIVLWKVLEERLRGIRETLARESAPWGRVPRLIAVTKYSTVEEILAEIGGNPLLAGVTFSGGDPMDQVAHTQ